MVSFINLKLYFGLVVDNIREGCHSDNCITGNNIHTNYNQSRVRRLAQPRIIRVRASSSPSRDHKKNNSKKEFQFDYERKNTKIP